MYHIINLAVLKGTLSNPFVNSRSLVRLLPLCLTGFVAALTLLSNATSGQTFDNNDFQIWNDNTIVLPLIQKKSANGSVDKVSLLITQTNRLDANRLLPLDERVGAGLEWAITKHVSITPNYRYQAARVLGVAWAHVHSFRFDTTFSRSWKSFSIRDRSRIERSFIVGRANTTRFRNRPMLRVPVHRGDKKIFDVFTSVESYYDFSLNRWSMSDLNVGITMPLSSHLSADFYFLHRDFIRSPRQDISGIGFNFRVRLD